MAACLILFPSPTHLAVVEGINLPEDLWRGEKVVADVSRDFGRGSTFHTREDWIEIVLSCIWIWRLATLPSRFSAGLYGHSFIIMSDRFQRAALT
ncbi:hypothetical protein Y032_0510g2732 [Ancylostoma ceylanicum]|uniref:Uncharacterized protein n=1 Tax=Ancylostoma ceylanicum TaxID=53326 RepID=A0A016WSZ7_9BILA|nr:hypothetical protein Y032_0510g2732 [Ancylostoma ceylanicum]